MSLSVISYGGGVQSTALLVLACQRKIKVDAALFCNVGDDSEHPATLEYVRKVARRYAAEHGIEVIELQRERRDGSRITLMEHMSRPGSRSVPIPVRGSEVGAPGARSCTVDYKIKVIAKWLKANGATAASPATVHIGFSFDEAHRIGNKRAVPYEVASYPLTDMRLTRDDCVAIIRKAMWPVPGKSSCFFCPFTKPSQFARMRRAEPLLFHKAVDLERMLNERRVARGVDPVYLTRFGRPLDEAVAEEQPGLDFGSGPGETCDEGHCWT